MNKEEFLIQLRECLEGQVSNDALVDALAYYRNYFQEEENNGRSEEEIIHFLGSPRLIAHSIIDAQEEAKNNKSSDYYDEDDVYEDPSQVPVEEKMGPIATRVKAILGILVAIAVAAIFLRVFIPVILVLIAVFVIYNFFKGDH